MAIKKTIPRYQDATGVIDLQSLITLKSLLKSHRIFTGNYMVSLSCSSSTIMIDFHNHRFKRETTMPCLNLKVLRKPCSTDMDITVHAIA